MYLLLYYNVMLLNILDWNIMYTRCCAVDEDGMDCIDNERRPHFPQFSYSASGREWVHTASTASSASNILPEKTQPSSSTLSDLSHTHHPLTTGTSSSSSS